jgi:mRNA interferase RelE/StbE
VYEARLHPRAEKQLDHLPLNVFDRIDKAIQRLRDNPRPQGVKKLYGRVHRIRVGDYRVIYSIFDSDKVVLISKIAQRSERTYRGL